LFVFFFQAEDGIRDFHVTGVQTCALPILVPLNSRNTPPNSKIRSRPENGCSRIWNSGSVKVTTQAIEASSTRRINKASIKPTMQIGRVSCRERGEGSEDEI